MTSEHDSEPGIDLDDAWFTLPDTAPTQICHGLWVGGTADEDTIGNPPGPEHYEPSTYPFDLVITLFSDAQPAPWQVEEIRYGFPDADLTDEVVERCTTYAAYAHERWTEGARVLVRCQQGLNRSGLVVALILMEQGHTGAQAVELLRAARGPLMLCNEAFETWLMQQLVDD